MRIGGAFLLAAVVSVCANSGLAAGEPDITLNNDSVIQDGDSYDDVFVYGDKTVVNVTGGKIGKLWCRNASTVQISGGRVTYVQSHDRSTVNITGGFVTKPTIWDPEGTINISGGTCWNVEAGNGVLNISGGQVTGMGVSVPKPGGIVNIYGYSFEYYPFLGRNDGRLKGYWADGTPFSIDFLRGAYRALALYEVSNGSAPMASAGEDRTVVVPAGALAQVTLDGSESVDPDGDALTYEWTWTINGDIFTAYGPKPAIMLPVGRHTIELIVSDGTGRSKADQVTITVQTLDQQIYIVRAEKLQLVQTIDAMMEKERQLVDALSSLLTGGSSGGLPRANIIAAREAVYASIQQQEQAKSSLQASIENLEETLLLIGSAAEPQESQKSDAK